MLVPTLTMPEAVLFSTVIVCAVVVFILSHLKD